MVSVELFSMLLKTLLNNSKLRKIVLLGDHLQLPSVEPGNFMEDLYMALKPTGLSIDLTNNHRSEGHLIFENAQRISNQQLPIFDKTKGFSLVVPETESISRGAC